MRNFLINFKNTLNKEGLNFYYLQNKGLSIGTQKIQM
jgi:hypothetical protein